jgi:hypothetical protein
MKTAVLLLLCCLPAFAKTNPTIQSGTVISQDVSSQNGGFVMVPIGAGLVSVPINNQSNIVVIESQTLRMTWIEIKSNKAIVLPVHGEIKFYQDGDKFIVIDSGNKKHKFALTHMETIK